MTKILFFEINEITPSLVDLFISQGKMPVLKEFLRNARTIQTKSDAEPPALEPWIQWYSAHTGLRYDEHHIFRLTQGCRAEHKDIWHYLAEKGLKTINFSSMNAKPLHEEGHIYLPDPWNDSAPFPPELHHFTKFIAKNVREYTDKRLNFSLKDYLSVMSFLLKHGLKFSTIRFIINQLTSELFQDKAIKYKRIFVLDRLMSNVFTHYIKKNRPDFATFFSNSIAHIQHAYWREFEPEKFAFCDHNPIKAKAMENTYINMDKIIGDMWRLAQDHDMKLIIAGALSQQPYIKEEENGGRHYYRPKYIASLLKKLSIHYKECEAVMTHQFMLYFENAEAKKEAWSILENCFLLEEGKKSSLFTLKEAENSHMPHSFIFDAKPRTILPLMQQINLGEDTHNFYDLFYKIDDVKSGYHHPDGILYFEEGIHPPQDSVIGVENIFDLVKSNYQ